MKTLVFEWNIMNELTPASYSLICTWKTQRKKKEEEGGRENDID